MRAELPDGVLGALVQLPLSVTHFLNLRGGGEKGGGGREGGRRGWADERMKRTETHTQSTLTSTFSMAMKPPSFSSSSTTTLMMNPALFVLSSSLKAQGADS